MGDYQLTQNMKKTKGNSVPLSAFGKGGKTTLKRYGKEHFSKMAKKMHAKRRKTTLADKRKK